MLSDNPRMTAYKNAILDKKDLFHNKIVMDVGAGTGKYINKYISQLILVSLKYFLYKYY